MFLVKCFTLSCKLVFIDLKYTVGKALKKVLVNICKQDKKTK